MNRFETAVLALNRTEERRGCLPVKNTFVHFDDDDVLQLRRCSSCPGSFAVEDAESGSGQTSEMLAAHIGGWCKPCIASVTFKDGCRHGGACHFCHFCTLEDYKMKRKLAYHGKKQLAKANGTWPPRKHERPRRRSSQCA
eukprot:TRINITY_DN42214_c0_g1_i1.p1 TRINITY_DN42214_c0_g1~~TRINITY_DN42214_c0_g1_i1.p1  ORF type:complete len:140 (-),score=27.04 TRINITY_DN42214_c0_g1_i1:119-538(-)